MPLPFRSILLLLWISLPLAWGFLEAVHSEITKKALQAAAPCQMPYSAVLDVVHGCLQVDDPAFNIFTWDPNHFLGDQFDASTKKVKERLGKAKGHLSGWVTSRTNARKKFGWALHTAQDLYAHTTVVHVAKVGGILASGSIFESLREKVNKGKGFPLVTTRNGCNSDHYRVDETSAVASAQVFLGSCSPNPRPNPYAWERLSPGWCHHGYYPAIGHHCNPGVSLDSKKQQRTEYAESQYFEMAFDLAVLHTKRILADFLEDIGTSKRRKRFLGCTPGSSRREIASARNVSMISCSVFPYVAGRDVMERQVSQVILRRNPLVGEVINFTLTFDNVPGECSLLQNVSLTVHAIAQGSTTVVSAQRAACDNGGSWFFAAVSFDHLDLFELSVLAGGVAVPAYLHSDEEGVRRGLSFNSSTVEVGVDLVPQVGSTSVGAIHFVVTNHGGTVDDFDLDFLVEGVSVGLALDRTSVTLGPNENATVAANVSGDPQIAFKNFTLIARSQLKPSDYNYLENLALSAVEEDDELDPWTIIVPVFATLSFLACVGIVIAVLLCCWCYYKPKRPKDGTFPSSPLLEDPLVGTTT